jgi:MFS family permease
MRATPPLAPEPPGGAAPGTRPSATLPATVIWLGVVSLLTDASSEMIYPLLPLFLTSVLGAGPRFVGAVEGIAETTASLLKLISGWLADRMPRKKPLTVIGYSLSSLTRPLVAAATAPWMVLVIRFADRVGKGLRSSPRDALLAEVTPAGQRGAAYGYHRAMDNTGAVIGPLAGFALVGGLGLPLRTVFALAALPAALAVASLLWGVREAPMTPRPTPQGTGAAKTQGATQATQDAGRGDRRALGRYLAAVGLFTLGNSSDAFLLLRARAAGVPEAEVLLIWTLHNAVKAALSHRFGALSDRLGRRRLIIVGWLLYGLTYLGFGLARQAWQIWLLFALYGLYYALVEGSQKALVADLSGPAERGRAFGYFHAVTGLLALPASLGFGLLYHPERPIVAFAAAAGCALAATIVLACTAPGKGPAPPLARPGTGTE